MKTTGKSKTQKKKSSKKPVKSHARKLSGTRVETRKKQKVEPRDKESKDLPLGESNELNADIKNDIYQTEVNPHVQKRHPLGKEKQAPDEPELNRDERIVNEQEDEIDENKYKGL